jgi:hypothetical protein
MSSNRGVVYLKPGSVEVQKIDFPSFRNPAGRTIDHGVRPWLGCNAQRRGGVESGASGSFLRPPDATMNRAEAP